MGFFSLCNDFSHFFYVFGTAGGFGGLLFLSGSLAVLSLGLGVFLGGWFGGGFVALYFVVDLVVLVDCWVELLVVL